MERYHPTNKTEIEDALKDIFAPMLEAILQGEMDNHLGYASNDHGAKDTDNRRNGYIDKTVRSSYGEILVSVPRDRDASFEPQVIPKRSKDITGIEDKVLGMYARGMSQRDISSTIEDMYGFTLSAESISNITDRILAEVDAWRIARSNRFIPLFSWIACMYQSVRSLRQKTVQSMLSLAMTSMALKMYWDFGLTTLKVNTTGCRFLMR